MSIMCCMALRAIATMTSAPGLGPLLFAAPAQEALGARGSRLPAGLIRPGAGAVGAPTAPVRDNPCKCVVGRGGGRRRRGASRSEPHYRNRTTDKTHHSSHAEGPFTSCQCRHVPFTARHCTMKALSGNTAPSLGANNCWKTTSKASVGKWLKSGCSIRQAYRAGKDQK